VPPPVLTAAAQVALPEEGKWERYKRLRAMMAGPRAQGSE
jgi:hypothetical protein